MMQPGLMHQMVQVPYLSVIPGGMMSKRRITVTGNVPMTATRFSVNLQCGPNTNPRDDIALHLNFRFDAQVPYVARNHLQMQCWGTEEGHGYLSFGRGNNFEIHIDNEHDHFKIYFNGLHFTDFRHRLPIQRVNYVAIDGDVVLTSVRFDGQLMSMQPINPPIVSASPQLGFGGSINAAPYPQQMHGQPVMGSVPMAPMGIPMGGGSHVPYSTNPVYPGYPTGRPYHATSSAIPVGIGTGLVAGAVMGHANKKMMKKQKKMMKKAMKPHKYSHKHFHHGLHGYHHKSSSSSSSSEEE